jgi:ligand-binding sensor domain-containing protein
LTSFGEADGFHSASVLAIVEGKDGTLYFADGDFYLNRYDGKSFDARRPTIAANSRSLWTSRYAFLDSRSEWWILTSEKLYRFSNSDFGRPLASYTSRDGLKADAMFQIFEDKRSDIWVSVQDPNPDKNGLARFDRSKNTFSAFTEAEGFPSAKSVSSFAEDNNGALWVGFYEGGIARYSDNRFASFDAAVGVPEGVITDLRVDRNGRLWLATTGGVGRIDDPGAKSPLLRSLTTANGLSSNNIRTLTEDRSGNIYAGTGEALTAFRQTNQIRRLLISDGLAVILSWIALRQGWRIVVCNDERLSRLEPRSDRNHAGASGLADSTAG